LPKREIELDEKSITADLRSLTSGLRLTGHRPNDPAATPYMPTHQASATTIRFSPALSDNSSALTA
jgi:hypothetical protein